MSFSVCLIIEGAYPHISGGVSSWAQSLIKSLPDIRFGVISICYNEIKHKKNYVFPDNVIEYYELDISKEVRRDGSLARSNPGFRLLRPEASGLRNDATAALIESYRNILEGSVESFEPFIEAVNKIDPTSFINSDEALDFFKEYHIEKYNGDNFLNNYLMWKFYFYTLIKLLKAKLPCYDIYHSLSTGFAGILGAALKIRCSKDTEILRPAFGMTQNDKANAKFLLTEHGLYTVERMRLYKGQFGRMDNISDFFEALGKAAYHYADKITTVCGVNRDFQIGEGALPEKIEVVNNGIDVERFSGIKIKVSGFPIEDFGNDDSLHCSNNKRVYKIGLVGRIVPIKDIFTFIKACKIIDERFKERLPRPFGARNDSLVPEARFYLIGPTDETKDYYKECQYLVKELGLKDKVIFTGTVNVLDYYADMDVMVLSSISEAQPIVLIEAMAAGIPIVATDVGGIRELIEGIGVIVPPCSPERIADAVIGILEGKKDKEINTTKGKEKAFKNHQITDMVNNYRRVYEELISKQKIASPDDTVGVAMTVIANNA